LSSLHGFTVELQLFKGTVFLGTDHQQWRTHHTYWHPLKLSDIYFARNENSGLFTDTWWC